jgi:hypothetical protein
VSLSDHEKRVLEELERGLYADDAKFVQRVGNGKPASASRVIGGALLALAGISVLVFAAVSHVIFVGVIGFLAMLLGLLIATSGQTAPHNKAQAKDEPAPKPKRPSTGSFFEDRWNNRS